MSENDTGDILRALGRIEGVMSGFRTEQERLNDYVANVSRRVGALEKSRSWAKGWAQGASAFVAAVVAVVTQLVINVVTARGHH